MPGPHLTVAETQLAVSGERGKYPDFADNVLTVETRDFWKDVSVSPSKSKAINTTETRKPTLRLL